MIQDWQDFLKRQQPTCNPMTAQDDTIFKLEEEALLFIHGLDAEDFLQSQFSNNISNCSFERGQLSCYCNPKGRILALLRVYQYRCSNTDEINTHDYMLVLSQPLLQTLQQRLTLYRMRARVDLSIAPDIVHFGAMGPGVTHWLKERALLPGHEPFSTKTANDVKVARITGHRFEIMTSVEKAIVLWQSLQSLCHTAEFSRWHRQDILAGIPSIVKETSEIFIPQMLNLDHLAAISFSKGCYPGQEIIARMRYLGRNRQRMICCHCDTSLPIPAGTPVYGIENGQKIGIIVDAVCNPDSGSDLLASIKLDAIDQSLHVGSAGDCKLTKLPLPYAVPELSSQSTET